MKEEKDTGEKTVKKKRLIYYIILAVSVLLLIAAAILTVYFVTGGNRTTLEAPPADGGEPSDPGDNQPGEGQEPSKPSEGDDTVLFASPLDYEDLSVMYRQIYHNRTTESIYRHNGVDIAAETGTAVKCMAEGTVETVSLSSETGNVIVVNHGGGLKSLYRFVEPVEGLHVGQVVAKGEQIATVAEAYGREAADGAHLHLEIFLSEKNVDPTPYLEPTYSEK